MWKRCRPRQIFRELTLRSHDKPTGPSGPGAQQVAGVKNVEHLANSRDCLKSQLRRHSPRQKPQRFLFLVLNVLWWLLTNEQFHLSALRATIWQDKKQTWHLFFFCPVSFASCWADSLTKEEFHLKQNVEPFIHYKEKQATFECITRENIEAVAAKVSLYCVCVKMQRLLMCLLLYKR